MQTMTWQNTTTTTGEQAKNDTTSPGIKHCKALQVQDQRQSRAGNCQPKQMIRLAITVQSLFVNTSVFEYQLLVPVFPSLLANLIMDGMHD